MWKFNKTMTSGSWMELKIRNISEEQTHFHQISSPNYKKWKKNETKKGSKYEKWQEYAWARFSQEGNSFLYYFIYVLISINLIYMHVN